MDETLRMLDGRWKGTSKVIFGEEVGSLGEYAPWLIELTEPITHRKSSVSGKELVSAPVAYGNGAKWLSLDEIDFSREFEPLNINEVKDIDSLIGALQERIYYAGNIVFGKSGHIEKSSNINDSFYIYNTARFGNSKYLAYCTIGRLNEACFGSNVISESANCVKCHRSFRNRRALELWMSQNCSDSYYSFGLENCANCLFSFNIQNARNAIGNLKIDAGKYAALKGKLLSELAQELKKNKRLPSLLEIVEKCRAEKQVFPVPAADAKRAGPGDTRAVETAFSQTTAMLFGRKLDGVDSYAAWLKKHTRIPEKCTSAAGGKTLFMPPYASYPLLPKTRLLGLDEARAYGPTVHLDAADVEELNLANAHKKLGKLAFFNIEFLEGSNLNLAECAISVDSANCYRSSVTEYSKNCAYSFWPRNCQNLFGCDSPFDSNSCINCYSCTTLTRCFEIDCCGYCSDAYFCHNCEGVYDAMFCFNVKNRRFAIGNSAFQPDKYNKIKSAILGQISEELEKNKSLKWDIYNVGCIKDKN